MNAPKHNQSGLTLIEALVAITLFAAVVIIIVGSFTGILSTQREVHNKQQVLNDLRLTLDVMAKELTSGSALPDDCADGCNSILFSSKARPDLPLRNISYRLDGSTGRIEKAIQTPFGLCSTLDSDGFPDDSCYQPISSAKVNIERLEFFIENTGNASTQPIITVSIAGTMLPGTDEEEEFQTSLSVTPRLLQDPDVQPPADNEPPSITIETPTTDSSYETSEASITVGGSASDNDEIDYVEWANEQTGSNGTADGTNSWSKSDITIQPGVTNTIRVTAYDEVGNATNDTIDIISTASPPPPEITDFDIYSENRDCPDARVELLACSRNADEIWVQRCNDDTEDCSDTSNFSYGEADGPLNSDPKYIAPVRSESGCSTNEGNIGNGWDGSKNEVDAGTTYRYRIKAKNTAAGVEGGFSSIITHTATCDPQEAPSSAPSISFDTLCSNETPTEPRIRRNNTHPNDIEGDADRIFFERCTGSGCTDWADDPTDPESTNDRSILGDEDGNPGEIQEGVTYRYRARAYNDYLSEPGPWSSPVTYTVPASPSCDGGSDDESDDENDDSTTTYNFTIDPSTNLIEVKVSGTVTTRRKSTETTLEIIPDDPSFNKDVTFTLSDDAGINNIESTFNPNPLSNSEHSQGSDFFVTIPDSTPTGTYTLEVTASAPQSNDATQTIYLDISESGGGQQ